MSSRAALFVLSASFFVLTGAVYAGSLNNNFVRWDDGLLIEDNPAIRALNRTTLWHAFSTYDPELYIPLTLVSYQVDYLIGGHDPFVYHLQNLLWHTLNALLVVWMVFLLSKRQWIALFAGALFAVHPLHTEAVVWASARKDVLSTFFFLGAVIAYLRRQERGKGGKEERYEKRRRGEEEMIEKKDCLSTSSPPLHPLLLSILSSSLPFLLFLLGLLSKVMVITLPAVLLLIDWKQGRALKQALKDKIPYVFLAIIFGIIAIYGKRAVITEASLFEMVLMAARSTMFYLEKLFLPTGFSVLYPYTDPITLASPDFFIPLLLLFSLLAILVFLRNPNVTFGLLFFLITLVPTFTTFAKDGVFYIASDRYAYIPSIGILFLVCSLIEAGRRKFSNSNFQFPFNFQIPIFNVALGVIVLLFAYLAHVQSQVWRDSETLFQRALAVSPNSFRAHNNLGNVYRMQGRYVEAIAEFEEAIAIRPMVRTYSNLGAVYRKMGSIDAALGQYESALELDPESAEAYFGLGIVYAQAGNTEEAFASYDRALELDPAYPDALTNRGALHMSRGEIDRALVDYEAALAVNPYFVHARYNLAVALSKVGEQEKAVQEYRRVTRDQPDFLPARVNLGVLLASLGRVSEARDQFRAILRIDPNNEGARSALQQLQ